MDANESTVGYGTEYDGDAQNKCNHFATDESSGDLETQPPFEMTAKNLNVDRDATEMR